jgi:hypothetical protein
MGVARASLYPAPLHIQHRSFIEFEHVTAPRNLSMKMRHLHKEFSVAIVGRYGNLSRVVE